MAREAAAPTPGCTSTTRPHSLSLRSHAQSDRITLALTRGPRRARALSADLITRLRARASKARDRPDRRVERVVMGRGCQHDHNLHASPRVPPAATNNADRCAVEGHRTSPDPGAPRAWQPTREACRHPGHRA